jgi:predicted DCC family thiol-disulfide oxidoreductase YuxK
VPDVSAHRPVVLFDGVCNLCNGVVQFLIRADDDAVLRYASLQSAAGRELLERAGLPPDQRDTFVLVEGDDAYTKSAAAIRVAEHLGGIYGLASAGRVVPRPIRDAVYDLVATYRYRVFGRREQCMIPTEDVRSRFLEGSEVVVGDTAESA